MTRFLLSVGIAALACAPAAAETDFKNLTPSERAVLGAAIRDALTGLPELLPGAPPRTPFEDEISTDLARIETHADRLFDPALPGFGNPRAALRLALFIARDCGTPCEAAETDLRALAATRDFSVGIIDIADAPDLVTALEIDTTPFIVFPDKFLRGHIPPIVLERYLGR